MKIIGHRGASALALENTVESIQAAIDAGVDAIEFDIRVTQDKKLVLSHDSRLSRVSKHNHRVHEHSLRKLKREVTLHNGQKIATLNEAIRAANGTPVVIEGKGSGWARPLAELLTTKTLQNTPVHSVISFDHKELYTFSLLMGDVPTYALESTNPFEVIRTARLLGFTGINIRFWLLNPLTYMMAHYYNLEITVYTVNRKPLAHFLQLLYPKVNITTDIPHELQFLRKKSRARK